MPRFSLRHFALLALCLALAGCLPFSCEREGYTSLTPSDSLSRQIASAMPIDTLGIVHTTPGPDAQSDRMQFPRTVRFGPEGHIFVSDVERNSLFEFDGSGRFVREIALDGFAAPYLSGVRGDTLIVYSATTDRIDFVVDGRSVRHVSVADLRPSPKSLFYVVGSDSALFTKTVGENTDGAISRLDRQGQPEAQVPLPGPYWRHAGFLRVWGDSLLSLSGFRPVVDVLPLDFSDGAVLDTMALVGFDSPMLARSRAFLTGDVDGAPLLSASAETTPTRLFALNMRPGWLHIDVFDHAGRLQHRITQPDPSPGRDFYPRDLAVRPRTDGRYDVAIILSSPEPQLILYRWPR